MDALADVREAPQYLRREGRSLNVTARTPAPMPLSRAQAAARLRETCGEAWTANPTGCNDLIRARYGESVPEAALPELAEAIVARFAPRPATIMHFDAKGGAACAN